jgi:hypothetical protein
MTKLTKPIQGTLFEEDYLVRTLGNLATAPDVALTELVANAWDAGASKVEIIIPEEIGEQLSIADDGCGMTAKQFKQRWMTLGYNRPLHQGNLAEFPPEWKDSRRSAYGRNGIGRHGLLCFASEYQVETHRDGAGARFVVTTSSGQNPFVLVSETPFSAKKHGTKLIARVGRHLPLEEAVRDVLAARFLHDPRFTVSVNGKSVQLWEHKGLIAQDTIRITDDVKADIFFVDSTRRARTTRHQGIAFWVGGRLVGTPSWILGARMIIDGRTALAKRYTVVVQSDDLFDQVVGDWSAFKQTETVSALFAEVGDYVEETFNKLASERAEETKETVLRQHRDEIDGLQPLAKMEIAEFVDEMATVSHQLPPESLSVAVRAVIHLEKSRSGASLLEKLSRLTDEDLEGLDRLLSDWSVRDALTVLDEIDRRLAVVEGLNKLSGDRNVDELKTLHPLVTQARWLFGPEFDTAEYASNTSLKNAVNKVFKSRLGKEAFENYRKRPDLLLLSDATISAVAVDELDSATGLSKMRDILLIELKRGGFKIGRDEVNQASGYVEDLLGCGLLDGTPFIKAFVVGYECDSRVTPVRTVGENPVQARISICTYGQLVRTAQMRLFRLKERLADRYDQISGTDLVSKVLAEPMQLKLANPQ